MRKVLKQLTVISLVISLMLIMPLAVIASETDITELGGDIIIESEPLMIQRLMASDEIKGNIIFIQGGYKSYYSIDYNLSPLASVLRANGFTVDEILINPYNPLMYSDVESYDIIVFSNGFHSFLTPLEEEVINSFVDDGGRLLLIGDDQRDVDWNTAIDMFKDDYNFELIPAMFSGYTSNFIDHEVTTYVSIVEFGAASYIETTGTATQIVKTPDGNHTLVAIDELPHTRVAMVNDGEVLISSRNRLFNLNLFNWLIGPDMEVDVVAENFDTSPYTESEWTNQTVDVTVTASVFNLKRLTVEGTEYPITDGVATAVVSVTDQGTTVINYEAENYDGDIVSGSFEVKIDMRAPWVHINGKDIEDTETEYLGYLATDFVKTYEYMDEWSGHPDDGALSKEIELVGLTSTPGPNQVRELHLSDIALNEATVTLEYHVISMDDLLQLIKPLELNATYKVNRTIPVKLELENGDPVMGFDVLTLDLVLMKGEEVVPIMRTNKVSLDYSTTQFVYDSENAVYQFNMQTKGLEVNEEGEQYTLLIYVDGKVGKEEGLIGAVSFTLVEKNKK